MSEKNKERFGKARLLTVLELAKELGCNRRRIYHLKKIGKLGYNCFKRKDGQWMFLYDEPYRIIESGRKYADLSELEKGISYIILTAQGLQEKVVELNKKFIQDEKKLLSARDKLKV